MELRQLRVAHHFANLKKLATVELADPHDFANQPQDLDAVLPVLWNLSFVPGATLQFAVLISQNVMESQ